MIGGQPAAQCLTRLHPRRREVAGERAALALCALDFEPGVMPLKRVLTIDKPSPIRRACANVPASTGRSVVRPWQVLGRDADPASLTLRWPPRRRPDAPDDDMPDGGVY